MLVEYLRRYVDENGNQRQGKKITRAIIMIIVIIKITKDALLLPFISVAQNTSSLLED